MMIFLTTKFRPLGSSLKNVGNINIQSSMVVVIFTGINTILGIFSIVQYPLQPQKYLSQVSSCYSIVLLCHRIVINCGYEVWVDYVVYSWCVLIKKCIEHVYCEEGIITLLDSWFFGR